MICIMGLRSISSAAAEAWTNTSHGFISARESSWTITLLIQLLQAPSVEIPA